MGLPGATKRISRNRTEACTQSDDVWPLEPVGIAGAGARVVAGPRRKRIEQKETKVTKRSENQQKDARITKACLFVYSGEPEYTNKQAVFMHFVQGR